jgi:transcription termination factor Rho
MSAETLERSVLEGKDRDQLIAIATALGLKALSRAKKGDIIDRILEQTGSPNGGGKVDREGDRGGNGASNGAPAAVETAGASYAPSHDEPDGAEPAAAWEIELREQGDDEPEPAGATAPERPITRAESEVAEPARSAPAPSTGPEGASEPYGDRMEGDGDGAGGGRRRRRRRRKGGGLDEGPQGVDRADTRDQGREARQSDDLTVGEPVEVAGYLDLRDEGYGFLRVNGYLPSRDDVYVSVKQTRQYGLRKGDHVTGLSRLAGRNEKNPALLQLLSVNGADPEQMRLRPRFEDLTPLFPDEKLRLENPTDPGNMTARIIDLIAPIGKGQRGLIVSPPKAGKTFIMKTIATSIERNNPEVKLIVLLIDERPEEVTDMRRTVQGEVIASTFDRPSDEHTHLAELAIEKAKRLVEAGHDVVVILDGITRLSRAYNLAAPATGRIMSGGIDAGALYPPKKFFGAARNIEEGGSLTILATALVETNSRMDDAIFEEFKGTGNMELRLDRKLAERRIFPAIDVDASSTRHEELLFDRKQLQQVWKLRRVLSGLAADGNSAPGLELLMDRLKTFRSNDEFLGEIAKQPTM